jgi:hypothetical protein
MLMRTGGYVNTSSGPLLAYTLAEIYSCMQDVPYHPALNPESFFFFADQRCQQIPIRQLT